MPARASGTHSAAAAYGARLHDLDARLERLSAGLLVAYSGGVDSSVLLHRAAALLGPRAAGLVADSPSLPRSELADAQEAAAAMGARLVVAPTDELADGRYRANAGDRCFFCKGALFEVMSAVARREGLAHLAYGAIADDALEHRPGARAAAEAGVHAPLAEAGFTKDDVRRYAREHGLAAAAKPAAACLASRLPVGTPVTRERLLAVESAEKALRALGFAGRLRVRHLGRRARVELEGEQVAKARQRERELATALAPAGFESFEVAAYGGWSGHGEARGRGRAGAPAPRARRGGGVV